MKRGDLFIRLSAGMPLHSQGEAGRLAWEFPDYVLKVAGKPELLRVSWPRIFQERDEGETAHRGE